MKKPTLFFLIPIIFLFMAACTQIAKPMSSNIESNDIIIAESGSTFFGEDTAVAVASDLASITLINDGGQQVQELMNCMAREPESLFMYAGHSRSSLNARTASNLQNALFERMVVQVDGQYEARGITQVPTVENGGVRLAQVQVASGDRVQNSAGQVVQLVEGVQLIDAHGQEVAFTGDPILMTQMEATFELQPFIWSDGTAVTAADSVFSFSIAAKPEIVSNKTRIQKTARYAAIDTHTIRWTGIPGMLDDNYPTYVWNPLPKHQLGHYSIDALLNAYQSSKMPLSYGRYVVESWIPGSHIVLVTNPHYYDNDPTKPVTRIHYEFLEPDAGF